MLASYVVRLSNLALQKDEFDRPRHVIHMDKVAPSRSISMDCSRFSIQNLSYEKRNDLFGVLLGTKDVVSTRDDAWKLEGVRIRPDV